MEFEVTYLMNYCIIYTREEATMKWSLRLHISRDEEI